MKRFRIAGALLLVLLLTPGAVSAATLASARTLVITEAPLENLYLTGTDITLTVPLPADLLAFGGTLSVAAPIAGDALLGGGTISITHPIEGDLRAAGGQVTVSAPVSGDLMLAGGSVVASTTARDTRIIGGTVRLTGSGGPVVIYGADVTLSGEFAGDVEVIASDRITLEEGTIINGTFEYDAPQQAAIPASAEIIGAVTYIGASSYLPTIEQAKTFALAGASVLFVVKIIAVLILAGLFAGLFPVFSQRVADKALARTPGRFALLGLLGFGMVFATPMLILLLAVSFVGIGVAFILATAYVLLLAVGYVYAGILAGAALSRGLMKRTQVTWKFALLGMLALYLISVVPVVGGLVSFVLFLVATGSIISILFHFAFTRTLLEETGEDL
ncbi:hypothetical protein KJ819_03130 [Patescibacteria group bacterium]|nr:hypothetical protein [Patescibacteria group bacterium]MBU1500736.1 hypothetical protein [Patescibacteria group bacterium]MBU2080791.1 hypothetical protein [Patescibacteria group bacterium]MBU2123896.1 hypothetical protein [Patescibacteria group bacterium]MBU2194813.1 hypothetical protein [Patescibacteria group bacterium]